MQDINDLLVEQILETWRTHDSINLKPIEMFLEKAIRCNAKVRMFGGNPVRWLGYLISHESNHRRQIALALKQAAMKLPEEIALKGLWGSWIYGKSPERIK